MSKDDCLQLSGKVIEVLPNATFRVMIDENSAVVIGVISGRMRKNNIKVLLGDKVDMEFSLYDLSRGRITRRN